jgi:UDP-N-acetyl-2-amino-2-deoxyglucuronate dehydrogenase
LHDVKLTYITSRGRWYFASWKGDEAKSGGIATNIGVHFYDMLSFVFGDLRENIVYHRAIDCAAGYLEYDRARVHWFLSINSRDLPEAVATSRKTYRSITIDGEEIEFSDGFTDLHIASYQKVLNGRGFRLADVRPSIETVAAIRTKDVDKAFDQVHPFIAKLARDQHRYEHGWPV